MKEPTAPEGSPPPFRKQRHGCLTAYLALLIVVNALMVLGVLVLRSKVPNLPAWVVAVSAGGLLLNIICAIALFRWKKWGFWAITAVGVLGFLISLYCGRGFASVYGLLGVVILYLVLQIGKERSGWSQLE